MTRDELYAKVAHGEQKINITDFDTDTKMWVYDELPEDAQELLIQIGLDLLVDVFLAEQTGKETNE